MKNIISLALVLLLVCSSASQYIGASIVGPLSKSAFACLRNQGGVNFVIIRIYKVSGTPGIDPNAAQTLTNANANFRPYGYMEICRGMDPVSQVTTMINGLPTLSNTVFIKVQPNTTPGCSWDGYTLADNCAFLTLAVQTLNTLNPVGYYGAGVFSTAKIWAKYFDISCDIRSLTMYIWYAIYDVNGLVDSTNQLGDFIPFGGWAMGSFKQLGSSTRVPLCGNPNWHALINYVTEGV